MNERAKLDRYQHLLKRISDKVYEGVTSEDLDCEQKALVWILNEINQFCLDGLPPEPIFVPNKEQALNKKRDSLDDEAMKALKDISDFIGSKNKKQNKKRKPIKGTLYDPLEKDGVKREYPEYEETNND